MDTKSAASKVEAPYTGPVEVGMVFDFQPGFKHRYERVTVHKKVGAHLWCLGRAGETFHEEPEFRKSVVLVSDKPMVKPRPKPAPLVKRYDGPIDVGMVFDFEPAKRHQYERLTITERRGQYIWARGRSGGTFYEESDFRDHVVPAA